MNHIADDAELYALGALDESEALAVRAHIQRCAPCLQAVRRAEQVVAAMSEPHTLNHPGSGLRDRILAAASPRRTSERRAWFAGGIVAGLAVAALVFAILRAVIPQGGNRDEMALQSLLHSHFNHVAFAGKAGAPPAKLLYGRHREWIFVIVDDTRPLHVLLATSSGKFHDVGILHAQGAVETFFLAHPPPFQDVYLASPDGLLTQAHPPFAK